MKIEDIMKSKVAALQDSAIDEATLLASIEEHNNSLPEVNKPDSLRLPSVEMQPQDAYECLLRLKAQCAQRNDLCVMCGERIKLREDSIGREILGTTYCGTRCGYVGRSLITDLKQMAGLSYADTVGEV